MVIVSGIIHSILRTAWFFAFVLLLDTAQHCLLLTYLTLLSSRFNSWKGLRVRGLIGCAKTGLSLKEVQERVWACICICICISCHLLGNLP